MPTEDQLARRRRRMARAAHGMGEISSAELAAELGSLELVIGPKGELVNVKDAARRLAQAASPRRI